MCRCLVEAGARVGAASQAAARRPLHYAALSREPKIVSLLVERGASVDDVDANNYTALTLAAHEGSFEATTMLLALGADANIATKKTLWLPLHLAAKKVIQL